MSRPPGDEAHVPLEVGRAVRRPRARVDGIGDTGLVGLRDVVVERLDDVDDEEAGPAVCGLAGSLLQSASPLELRRVVCDSDAHDATSAHFCSSCESSASSSPPAIWRVSSSRLTSARFLSSTAWPSLRMTKWLPTR